jgi:glycogen debranching enzyme
MAGDLTVLDGNTFFVSDQAGDVEPGELPNGFFHADMRHLSKWRLLVNGRPQAWAAGAPLLALRTALGLDVVDRTLRIDPHLSQGWGRVRLHNIAVGAKAAATVQR